MSVANDIGAAVVAAIQAVGLEVSTGVALASANVVQRKRPELAPKEQPPKVFVCVNDQPETVRLTAAHKLNRWNVTVAVVTAGGSVLQEDTRLRTWLESIEAKLFDTQAAVFASLTGFLKLKATTAKPFNDIALSKDIVYALKTLEVQVVKALST